MGPGSALGMTLAAVSYGRAVRAFDDARERDAWQLTILYQAAPMACMAGCVRFWCDEYRYGVPCRLGSQLNGRVSVEV